jgi:DNA-binding transcriptional MerR regulator
MEEEYTIQELAKKAKVTVRTIRYYSNEGVLPTPQARGRYTVYSEEFLDRLELIQRLKDSYLPLKEIRDTLTSLSWEEVRLSLAEFQKREAELLAPPPKASQDFDAKMIGEDRSSALDYISKLLSSTPISRPLPPSHAQQPHVEGRAISPPSNRESWERVALTNRLELHIRQPVRSEDWSKIQEIVELSKKLFST